MAYTEEQTIDFIKNITDMNILYKQNFIKNYGQAKGSQRHYPEILADWMLSNNIPNKMKEEIAVIPRDHTYKMVHEEEFSDAPTSNRVEEWIARKMFTEKHYKIGEILDYQVPLKDVQDTSDVGKIDLIACNNDKGCVYLLELKRDDNKESLLRAVLEIYTYSRQLYRTMFDQSYNDVAGKQIIPAVLVFEGSLQHQEYTSPKYPRLHELMETLGVEFFVVKNAKFLISDQVKTCTEPKD